MCKQSKSFKIICSLLTVLFFVSITGQAGLAPTGLAYAEVQAPREYSLRLRSGQAGFPLGTSLNLPSPSQFVPLSKTYSYPVLKGLKIDPDDPFKFEFIIDTKGKEGISDEEVKTLTEYFLAVVTTPSKDLWVNLSPYEKDRIISDNLSDTELGKGLLSQDYILKQLLASVTHPESKTGKDYWSKTYKEIAKIAKNTNIPIDTFNKIWITPETAKVIENNNIAFITEASLKAMLEEDMQSAKGIAHSEKSIEHSAERIAKETKDSSQPYTLSPMLSAHARSAQRVAHETMKQTILPKIEKDINYGENFAKLRQIYNSFILGVWFKKKLKDSIYQHYINQNKTKGIDLEDKTIKDKVYNLYTQAYKQGLYDYVKTEKTTEGSPERSRRTTKRRYFSGGIGLLEGAVEVEQVGFDILSSSIRDSRGAFKVTFNNLKATVGKTNKKGGRVIPGQFEESDLFSPQRSPDGYTIKQKANGIKIAESPATYDSALRYIDTFGSRDIEVPATVKKQWIEEGKGAMSEVQIIGKRQVNVIVIDGPETVPMPEGMISWHHYDPDDNSLLVVLKQGVVKIIHDTLWYFFKSPVTQQFASLTISTESDIKEMLVGHAIKVMKWQKYLEDNPKRIKPELKDRAAHSLASQEQRVEFFNQFLGVSNSYIYPYDLFMLVLMASPGNKDWLKRMKQEDNISREVQLRWVARFMDENAMSIVERYEQRLYRYISDISSSGIVIFLGGDFLLSRGLQSRTVKVNPVEERKTAGEKELTDKGFSFKRDNIIGRMSDFGFKNDEYQFDENLEFIHYLNKPKAPRTLFLVEYNWDGEAKKYHTSPYLRVSVETGELVVKPLQTYLRARDEHSNSYMLDQPSVLITFDSQKNKLTFKRKISGGSNTGSGYHFFIVKPDSVSSGIARFDGKDFLGGSFIGGEILTVKAVRIEPIRRRTLAKADKPVDKDFSFKEENILGYVSDVGFYRDTREYEQKSKFTHDLQLPQAPETLYLVNYGYDSSDKMFHFAPYLKVSVETGELQVERLQGFLQERGGSAPNTYLLDQQNILITFNLQDKELIFQIKYTGGSNTSGGRKFFILKEDSASSGIVRAQGISFDTIHEAGLTHIDNFAYNKSRNIEIPRKTKMAWLAKDNKFSYSQYYEMIGREQVKVMVIEDSIIAPMPEDMSCWSHYSEKDKSILVVLSRTVVGDIRDIVLDSLEKIGYNLSDFVPQVNKSYVKKIITDYAVKAIRWRVVLSEQPGEMTSDEISRAAHVLSSQECRLDFIRDNEDNPQYIYPYDLYMFYLMNLPKNGEWLKRVKAEGGDNRGYHFNLVRKYFVSGNWDKIKDYEQRFHERLSSAIGGIHFKDADSLVKVKGEGVYYNIPASIAGQFNGLGGLKVTAVREGEDLKSMLGLEN